MSGLERLAGPAEEPLSLEEARAHLRLETTDDDALLGVLVAAARGAVEDHLGRTLVTQSWRLWRDAWPLGPEIPLPRPPLQAVIAVAVLGPDGQETPVPPAAYLVDRHADPGRLIMRSRIPPAPLREVNALRIDFAAGYGEAAAVPLPIRHAVRLLVAHWYERREPPEAPVAEGLPGPVTTLLAPYRRTRL